MTAAPQSSSSGTAGALSAQLIEAALRPACDTYSATLLLHASQMIDRLISPTPQIAGGVREALKLGCYMTACAGDDEYQIKIGFASLADMQSAHSALVAALSPQAQAGEQEPVGTMATVDDPRSAPAGYNKGSERGRRTCDVAQAAQEPDAWQWRYVGDRYWKTRSGGLKLTPSDMKNERPIEQRPLYASPPAALPAGTVTVPLEALRNCGCPADFRGTIGQCEDSGQCGCSINLKGRTLSSTEGKSDV